MLNKIRDRIKAVFYFSNSESNGLLAIIVLILLLIIAPKAFKLYCGISSKPLDHTEDIALLEKNLMLLQQNASKVVLININTTFAQQLEELAGVDGKLARRIISYRDKLGGFVSLDQYGEVYGMSNYLRLRLAKQTIVTEKYLPKQLSLNHATFKELVVHPYVSPDMAKAIIACRKKKGKFIELTDIQKLPGYEPTWGKKIRPYLCL
jgi:DNA uptake protein ComE-like DNA-binding protein